MKKITTLLIILFFSFLKLEAQVIQNNPNDKSETILIFNGANKLNLNSDKIDIRRPLIITIATKEPKALSEDTIGMDFYMLNEAEFVNNLGAIPITDSKLKFNVLAINKDTIQYTCSSETLLKAFYQKIDASRTFKMIFKSTNNMLSATFFDPILEKIKTTLNNNAFKLISLGTHPDTILCSNQTSRIPNYRYKFIVSNVTRDNVTYDVIQEIGRVVIDMKDTSIRNISDNSVALDNANKTFHIIVNFYSNSDSSLVLLSKDFLIVENGGKRPLLISDFNIQVNGTVIPNKSPISINDSDKIQLKIKDLNGADVTIPGTLILSIYGFESATSNSSNMNSADFGKKYSSNFISNLTLDGGETNSFSLNFSTLDATTSKIVSTLKNDILKGKSITLLGSLVNGDNFINLNNTDNSVLFTIHDENISSELSDINLTLIKKGAPTAIPYGIPIQTTANSVFLIQNNQVSNNDDIMLDAYLKSKHWYLQRNDGKDFPFIDTAGGWSLGLIKETSNFSINLYDSINHLIIHSWLFKFIAPPKNKKIILVSTIKNRPNATIEIVDAIDGTDGRQGADNNHKTLNLYSTFSFEELDGNGHKQTPDLDNFNFNLEIESTDKNTKNVTLTNCSDQEIISYLNNTVWRTGTQRYLLTLKNNSNPLEIHYFEFRFRDGNYVNFTKKPLGASYILYTTFTTGTTITSNNSTSFAWEFNFMPLSPVGRVFQDMFLQPGIEFCLPYTANQTSNSNGQSVTASGLQYYSVGLRNTFFGVISMSYGYTNGNLRNGSYFNIGLDVLQIFNGDIGKLSGHEGYYSW